MHGEKLGTYDEERDNFLESDTGKKVSKQIDSDFEKYAKDGFSKALKRGNLALSAAEAVEEGYLDSVQFSHIRKENRGEVQKNLSQMIGKRVLEYASQDKTWYYNPGEADEEQIEHDKVYGVYSETEAPLWEQELKNDAYLDAIEKGTTVTQNENGDYKEEYTIPQNLYGEIQDKLGDLELNSEEARNRSYSGFLNIASAAMRGDLPDESGLDFYYNKFHYGEHPEEVEEILSGMLAERKSGGFEKVKNASLRNFLEDYLDKQSSWNEYRENSENVIKETEDNTNGDLEIIKEDVPEYRVPSDLYQRACKELANYLGVDENQFNLKGIKVTNNLLGFDEGKEDPRGNNNGPRGPRGDGFANKLKLLKRQLLLNYLRKRIRDQGIDENATMYTMKGAANFSGQEYSLLEFHSGDKTYIIGEARNKTADAAIYTWFGEGEEWKEYFAGGFTKNAVTKIPGIRRFNHSALRGLAYDYDRVLADFVRSGGLSEEVANQISLVSGPKLTSERSASQK